MKIKMLILFLLPLQLFGQAEKKDYFAITFENDALALPGLTDKYYTNGIRLEHMGPRFENRNYLLNKVLVKKKQSNHVELMYGSFFGQNMYTPLHIDSANVQVGDRPFSGWLYGGVKCISTDTARRERFTSELYLGVIGPYAFAGETQTFIHKISHSTIPHGWSHQIDSDLGINYVFRYERMITSLPKRSTEKFRQTKHGIDEVLFNHFEAIVVGEINAGTVFNNLLAGGIVRAGWMAPYFRSYNFGSGPIIKLKEKSDARNMTEEQSKKETKHLGKYFSQLFVFAKPQIRTVLYNAMLQGGLFNKESEYTVAGNHVEPVYVQLDYGLGITYRSVTLTYYQSTRSKEFSFSKKGNHNWGGVNLIFNY